MSALLGEKVKRLRKERKMTLEQLANIAGSRKSYVWELENRGIKPSAFKLYKMAKHFGVTLEYLVDDNMKSPEVSDIDQAYFFKFQNMNEGTKGKIRNLIDTWENDD